jgi:nucleoid-associated protein YgaU
LTVTATHPIDPVRPGGAIGSTVRFEIDFAGMLPARHAPAQVVGDSVEWKQHQRPSQEGKIMHRDKRIGLGLGILLVGVVGALFFRREPADKSNAPPPPLESAKELNRQIAEKPNGPYIVGGTEEFLATAPTPPARQPQASSERTPDAFRKPQFLNEQADVFSAGESGRSTAAPAPDPITTESRRPTATETDRAPRDLGARESASADPAHDRDDAPAIADRGGQPILVGTIEVPAPIPMRSNEQPHPAATADSPAASTRDAAATATTSRVTHVTKAGETLSAIAAKYLGSSAKYHEIYEANKDVLHSPNVVPEGVTLVIPKAAPARSAPAATTTKPESGSAAHTEPTATPRAAGSAAPPATDSGRLKFEPVHRSPFAAGRAPKSQSGASPAPSSSSSVIEEAPSLDANRRTGPVNLLSPENESIDTPPTRNARPRTYKVQRGDTLEAISVKFYGVRGKSDDLFKANRDKLASPNALREGLEIVVP